MPDNDDPSLKQVYLSQYPVRKQLLGEDNYCVRCKTLPKFTQDPDVQVREPQNTRCSLLKKEIYRKYREHTPLISGHFIHRIVFPRYIALQKLSLNIASSLKK